MLARGIPGSGRTRGVSFRPFPNSSGWWWLISSVFLIRISCYKTTHANGYCGAWPGWVVSISVLPLTLSETSGSFLGTDSPWTHWRNKLCFTVLSVLRGVFCDSGFHSQRTKTPGWPNVTIWSTTTVLSFFCPPGFSTEWTSQGKKTLKARTFLSPKSVA